MSGITELRGGRDTGGRETGGGRDTGGGRETGGGEDGGGSRETSGGGHGGRRRDRVIEHRWERAGWAPFRRHVVNQHDDQAFTLDVDGDDGLVTGTVAGPGNQRELYVHRATRGWSAGEVTALIGRPSTYSTAGEVNRPQAGVVLGYERIHGDHVAYVVWYDVFVGNPDVWNISAWRGDGGPDLGQAAGGQHIASLRRDLRILQVERFSFQGWINTYIVQPYHLHDLATGDLVNVDAGDDTFDESGVAVANADPAMGVVQVFDPSDPGAVPLATAGGAVRPAEGHKRWFPCWIKARRVERTVSMKAWRTTEPEPAGWQATVTIRPNDDVPELPSDRAGGFGLMGAHAHAGSSVRFGPVTFRRLG